MAIQCVINLIEISENKEQVNNDIIENINIQTPVSVQITICSTYVCHDIFSNEELGNIFLNKIISSIEVNKDNHGIVSDRRTFLKVI